MVMCADNIIKTNADSSEPTTSYGVRDNKIDMLRFIGMSLIILMHVEPPWWLMQMRDFDVPLMVLVSGLAFMRSTSRQNYLSYFWKRIKRLLFPVWLFLTFYFILNWTLQFAPEDLNAQTILSSYAFIYGIGYVWIIRVFLLTALTAPLMRYTSGRIDSNKLYLTLLLICWGGYELFLYAAKANADNVAGEILLLYVCYAIGYTLIIGFGIRLEKLKRSEVGMVCAMSFIAFVVMGVILYLTTGKVTPTLRYKYPPSSYYIFYSMFLCCFLWILSDRIVKVIKYLPAVKELIAFVARNSIWIYLWHILAIKFIKVRSSGSFLSDYLIVYSFAMAITWVQVGMVTKIVMPRVESLRLKQDLKTILTG